MKNVAVTFLVLKSIIQVHLVLGKGLHVTRTNYSARKVAKKIKNIIKSEVCKPSLHHREKYLTTLEVRGKLLSVTRVRVFNTWSKELHRSFNKNFFRLSN